MPRKERNSFGSMVALMTRNRFLALASSFFASDIQSSSCELIWWLHQMSSQLELCMSLAKKEEASARNLFRVMSATIDPKEFLSFLGIRNLYRMSGRRYPVTLQTELAGD